jgi:hypothetical protein
VTCCYVVVELRGFEPLTPCMPCHPHHFTKPSAALLGTASALPRAPAGQGAVVRREAACGIAADNLLTVLKGLRCVKEVLRSWRARKDIPIASLLPPLHLGRPSHQWTLPRLTGANRHGREPRACGRRATYVDWGTTMIYPCTSFAKAAYLSSFASLVDSIIAWKLEIASFTLSGFLRLVSPASAN